MAIQRENCGQVNSLKESERQRTDFFFFTKCIPKKTVRQYPWGKSMFWGEKEGITKVIPPPLLDHQDYPQHHLPPHCVYGSLGTAGPQELKPCLC